jgi:hypothetical protein
VQAVELRTGHVPVEVVGHQVQRVAVSQQGRQAFRDLLAIRSVDADVNRGHFFLLACHHSFSICKSAGSDALHASIMLRLTQPAKPKAFATPAP